MTNNTDFRRILENNYVMEVNPKCCNIVHEERMTSPGDKTPKKQRKRVFLKKESLIFIWTISVVDFSSINVRMF